MPAVVSSVAASNETIAHRNRLTFDVKTEASDSTDPDPDPHGARAARCRRGRSGADRGSA